MGGNPFPRPRLRTRLHVSKPYGDCLPYDFIVEKNGRMLSVQVKSTSYMPSGCRPYSCHVRPLRGRRYRAAAVDYLAAYIIPKDVWYIVPYTDLNKRTLFIPLDPGNQRNPYEKYLEAWHLLLTSTRGTTVHGERSSRSSAKQSAAKS